MIPTSGCKGFTSEEGLQLSIIQNETVLLSTPAGSEGPSQGRIAMMNAAVVHRFGETPRCESFDEPVLNNEEVLVHVAAAALNPSTK